MEEWTPFHGQKHSLVAFLREGVVGGGKFRISFNLTNGGLILENGEGKLESRNMIAPVQALTPYIFM